MFLLCCGSYRREFRFSFCRTVYFCVSVCPCLCSRHRHLHESVDGAGLQVVRAWIRTSAKLLHGWFIIFHILLFFICLFCFACHTWNWFLFVLFVSIQNDFVFLCSWYFVTLLCLVDCRCLRKCPACCTWRIRLLLCWETPIGPRTTSPSTKTSTKPLVSSLHPCLTHPALSLCCWCFIGKICRCMHMWEMWFLTWRDSDPLFRLCGAVCS